MLKIVYDPNIPFVENVFSALGMIMIPFNPNDINFEIINSADVLVIRSTIKVNKQLVENATNLKIICTASAGLDHIDLPYATQRNIKIFDASGTNILAVADYVLAAFFALSTQGLPKIKVGIIGLGKIGKVIYKRFESLGCTCLAYDPHHTNNPDFKTATLAEVLATDVVTIHVPLVMEGVDKTFHLISTNEFAKLSPQTILINTSRGEIIDEGSLKVHLLKNPYFKIVLDVWNNEPNVDAELVAAATLATPHIAGWSETARKNALIQLLQQTKNFYECKTIYSENENLNKKTITCDAGNIQNTISQTLEKCTELKKLSDAFKTTLATSQSVISAFNNCRATYKSRPQLTDFNFVATNLNTEDKKILNAFDCTLSENALEDKLSPVMKF